MNSISKYQQFASQVNRTKIDQINKGNGTAFLDVPLSYPPIESHRTMQPTQQLMAGYESPTLRSSKVLEAYNDGGNNQLISASLDKRFGQGQQ